MIRRVIQINEEKCNGCGACVSACHEGAIAFVDGKARLMRDDYCDGFGDCLPNCPAGAISFIEREAAAYDEAAVLENKAKKQNSALPAGDAPSRLGNWPVQIKLVPVSAPYYDGAELLIAADCTAYAYGNMHRDFIGGKVTLVGCPKLDNADYGEKLGEIMHANNIKSVTLVRMQVPCCGGLELALRRAIKASGKLVPMRVVVLSNDGRIISG